MESFKIIKYIFSLILSATVPGLALAEDSCIQPEDHQKLTYFLIDRSENFSNKDGFQKSADVLKQMIQSGERLIIGVSTDKGGTTRVLMDLGKPIESVWTSTLKIRAQQKKFTDCFDKTIKELVSSDEKYKQSAILETLLFISKIIESDKSESKRLVLYSDMTQNSNSISFYSLKTFNTESLLKQAEKEKLIAQLNKVEVLATGTGENVADKRARELEEFWRAYFEKAGASLRFYGPVLLNLG